jgi:transposase
MEVIHKRCAGGDVDAKRIVVCVRIARDRRVHRETRTFETTTKGLLALADWLEESRCTHILLESTGVYWRPVYHIVSERLTVVLANAAEVKNVPGRKSDVSDAAWLADLMAHGLVRASFVPPPPIQELRDLTRTRKQLVREVARHKQRLQKILEDANVKIAHVLSDLLGESGRRTLEALIAGETDPSRLADLGDVRLKSAREDRVEALRGRVTEHHRFMLNLHLTQIRSVEKTIDDLDQRIGKAVTPFRDILGRVVKIPGISKVNAPAVLGEIGIDMSPFPTGAQIVSWAGVCPQLNTSAGRKLSTKTRRGNVWLKTLLVQAAWAASRTKGTYFEAKYRRLRARRGPQKALIAVAASLLIAIYHVIRDGAEYRDLGGDHFDRLANKDLLAKRYLRRLEKLGFHVTITTEAA